MVSSLHHMAVSLAPPGYQYALYAALYAASRAPWWWSCGAVQLQPESTSAPSPEFDCIPLKLSHSRLARSVLHSAWHRQLTHRWPPVLLNLHRPIRCNCLACLAGLWLKWTLNSRESNSAVVLNFSFFLAHAQAQASKCTISFKETTANTV